jgi:transposase
MRRHEIKDEDWERIKDMLPGQPGDPGVTAKDNRLFINAVLWIAKTGAPWRDLPERFGPWGSVWKRLDRWAKKGVWQRAFEALQDPDLEWMILDSTVVRAHQHAAGAEKGGETTIRRWAARGADSAPRSTSSWTPWATRSSSS